MTQVGTEQRSHDESALWRDVEDRARGLTWRVKDSFRSYVQRSGGSVKIVHPATVADEAFHFARSGSEGIAFAGGVLFMAHAGFLKVLIAEPSIRPTGEGYGLFVADTTNIESADAQWQLATLRIIEASSDRLTLGARLTAAGAALFGGVYSVDEEFDALAIDLKGGTRLLSDPVKPRT